MPPYTFSPLSTCPSVPSSAPLRYWLSLPRSRLTKDDTASHLLDLLLSAYNSTVSNSTEQRRSSHQIHTSLDPCCAIASLVLLQLELSLASTSPDSRSNRTTTWQSWFPTSTSRCACLSCRMPPWKTRTRQTGWRSSSARRPISPALRLTMQYWTPSGAIAMAEAHQHRRLL
jgi:hypothetical protein